MPERERWSEPVPSKFYCPRDQYEAWLKDRGEFPGEWLGDTIRTIGNQSYPVLSAPCSPLYWGNGYAEPDKIQSAWIPKDAAAYAKDPVGYGGDRRNWIKANGNYLAYEIPAPYSPGGTRLLTVRWQPPNNAGRSKPCPLSEPMPMVA